MTRALVLGVYQQQGDDSSKKPVFTDSANQFDQAIEGKLKSFVSEFGPIKKGRSKIYYKLHPDYPVVSVVNLGPINAGFNDLEDLDEKRENIRCAIGVGVKAVRNELGVDEVHIDHCDLPEAAAEAAHLALWHFDELKSEKYKKKQLKVGLYEPVPSPAVKEPFELGTTLATAQNYCRRLAEMPSNLLTPRLFANEVHKLFESISSYNVFISPYDKYWAEGKKMNAFLSVAKGSAQEPIFLEVRYNNNNESKPFVLVGKGVCFDSGGISIKSSKDMDKMRYDMSGAANVISTIFALVATKAKVNVIGLMPLVENLPSGTASKPGDVVVAMNGKSIQIDNTDAEGRLILADALCYADEFNPQAVLDIATLTGAMGVALGSAATGVFTQSNNMFNLLKDAGAYTGDRVWRMPSYSYYKHQVTDSQLADCINVGKVAGGGACTAAAFLSEFIKCSNWVHLDMAGVGQSREESAYITKGMTGRPMRTLYYFVMKWFQTNV